MGKLISFAPSVLMSRDSMWPRLKKRPKTKETKAGMPATKAGMPASTSSCTGCVYHSAASLHDTKLQLFHSLQVS